MIEAWFSSSESTASSGPNKTWWGEILFYAGLFLTSGNALVTYLKQPSISIKTAGIEDAVLPLVEFGQLLLEVFVDILKILTIWSIVMRFNNNTYIHLSVRMSDKDKAHLCATDKSNRAQTGTMSLESINSCLYYLWMTGQAKVVVGTEI